MSLVALLILETLVLFAIFGGLLLLARRIDNYSFVDAVWSYSFAPIIVLYAWLAPGWLPRRVLLAAVVVTWSVRLGTHVLRRVLQLHPQEEGRYVEFRRSWGATFAARMRFYYLMQIPAIAPLTLGFLAATYHDAPRFHPLEIAGTLLWLIAVIGEAVADAQLAAFKRQPANRGRVCDVGLWRFSRHPNYFCEWLTWVAYAVFCLGSPWGWLGLIGPAAILYLLLRVTGIPLTEEQSLRSKGDAYRRYQQTTPAFFPWFPKKLS